MSSDPVSLEALRLEVARLEAENAVLRERPGPQGPAGPMGPMGMPAMPDPMAGQRHMETLTALNGLASAVHRIANLMETKE